MVKGGGGQQQLYGENSAIKDGEGRNKAVIEGKCVPVHCTREVRNMMISNLSPKAHHANVCEKAVHFWKKGPYGDVLSHTNYKRRVRSVQGIRGGEVRWVELPSSDKPRRYTSP